MARSSKVKAAASEGPFKTGTFFTKIVHAEDVLSVSAGYENSAYRNQRLAELLLNALPEFALNLTELKAISHLNMVDKLREAALSVYESEKFKNRGEFGELLLHVIMRDFFKTIPAVSKIYYKDSANNTVKGFDAVHVVETKTGLELWLGETKFYSSISRAMADVAKDLESHTQARFLRNEFIYKILPVLFNSQGPEKRRHQQQ
ncbi:MAG: DUF1837 domain-containing protein, partial [Proteobacteria bacterium]